MTTDNITNKNTLKSWFKRGLKPLETQFHAWMDSYWHKSEKIPTSSVKNLENTLNSKAENKTVEEITRGIEEHISDNSAHKTEKEQNKLNNLAANPDATYASKDELKSTKEYNTLYLNTIEIADGENIQNGVLDADLLEQFSKFDNLGKPYNLVFNDVSMYVCDNVQSMKTNDFVRIIATIPDELQKDMRGNTIDILFIYSSSRIVISSSTKSDYIFLTENIDGLITVTDNGWVDFQNKLMNGKKPVVYLKSENSDGYCPVFYEFIKDSETNVLRGFVGISYPKIGDGVKELWVEKWVFTNNIVSALYQYNIEKFPLECPAFIIETDDGYNNVLNPEIVGDIVTAYNQGKNLSIALKNQGMLNKADIYYITDSECIFSFSHILTISGTVMNNVTIEASRSASGAWDTMTIHPVSFTPDDFMQVKNIYIAADYPASLTGYPDGSIFIKQQAS